MLHLINNRLKFITIATLLSFNFSYGAQKNECIKGTFDINTAQDTTINELITQLSDTCGFSVIKTDDLSSKILAQQAVGINIKNMKLDRILKILLAENNLDYTYSGNVLKVSGTQTRTFNVDYITSIREGKAITKASVDSTSTEVGSGSAGQDAESVDNTITVVEKFNFWDKLDAEIKAVLNNGIEEKKFDYRAPDPIINQNAGLITITGLPSQIKRVSNYISNMQRRLKKQVVIDVSIISVNLKNEYKKGVDWSKFDLNINAALRANPGRASGQSKGFITYNGIGTSSLNITTGVNLEGILNFLETNGHAKVMSSPKITTLNNQQALISIGDTAYYTLKSRAQNLGNGNNPENAVTTDEKQYSMFVGILLHLLPEVSDDNKIMLRINPSLSDFKDANERTAPAGGRGRAPETTQRKLSTVVQVNSGETIILGGLIKQTKGKTNNRVPILSSIPLIGNAFKSSVDTNEVDELVFVITPRVVDIDNYDFTNSLKELGYSKSIYE